MRPITRAIAWGSAIILTFLLLLYIADMQKNITVDWSLILPLLAAISATIPFIKEMINWADRRLSRYEPAIQELAEKLQEVSNSQKAHEALWGHRGAQEDIEKLEGIILQVQAKVSTLVNKKSG